MHITQFHKANTYPPDTGTTRTTLFCYINLGDVLHADYTVIQQLTTSTPLPLNYHRTIQSRNSIRLGRLGHPSDRLRLILESIPILWWHPERGWFIHEREFGMTRIGGLQEESAHMSQIMTPPKIWIFTLNSCPSMFVNYSGHLRTTKKKVVVSGF